MALEWPFPMESAHPLVVHFPIALLSAAVLLDLLALALKRPAWHRVALWNLCLGTVGAAAAVLTGLRAAEVAKHTFAIHQVMELHQKLGITTLIIGSVVAVWRLAARDRLGPPSRTLSMLLMAAMVGTLASGAHLGGRLVYEFGVGGAFGGAAHHAAPDYHH